MNPKIHLRSPLIAGFMLILLTGLQTACNLPAFATKPSATIIPTLLATHTPSLSPIPPTAISTSTLRPTLTPTITVSPTLASPTPKPLYQGFISYDRAQQTITGYDFAGSPLKISIKVTGAEWIGFNQGQWANDSIYFVKQSDKTVMQIANNGAAQKLAFIPAKDDLSFSISNDGKRIAWSFSTFSGTNPASELWTGNLDGSNLKQVAKIDAAGNSKWLVLHPYRWLPDGRLLYIDEPTGIGGYILFYGFAGLHLYDPSNNKLTNLTPGTGAGNLCLREISPDLKTLASSCATNQDGVLAYISMDTNKAVSITRQADQNQVGSPAWSPSGSWMAYAYARGNNASELGVVALVANSTTTPKILASLNNGYFNVKAWINESQFIVQRFEGDLSSTWLFSRDGSAPVKLADGVFISLVSQ